MGHVSYMLEMWTGCRPKRSHRAPPAGGSAAANLQKEEKIIVVSHDLAWPESILQREVRRLSCFLSLKEYLQSL